MPPLSWMPGAVNFFLLPFMHLPLLFYIYLHFKKTPSLDAPSLDARGRRTPRYPLCTSLWIGVWWRPRCHCVGGGPHVVSKSWRLANDVGATNGGDGSTSGELIKNSDEATSQLGAYTQLRRYTLRIGYLSSFYSQKVQVSL